MEDSRMCQLNYFGQILYIHCKMRLKNKIIYSICVCVCNLPPVCEGRPNYEVVAFQPRTVTNIRWC